MNRGCQACKHGIQPPMPFTMAFQPIVDVRRNRVYAYEALVRGPQNQSAPSVLTQVTPETLYSFDQSCRITAIRLAHRLGLVETGARLSINFMPGAVYSPAACIQLTLQTARELRFPTEQLMFEITEGERVLDTAHLRGIATEYRRQGLQVALDDFGEGYSNLGLLAELPVDVVKLDMGLIRNVDSRPRARRVLESTVTLCHALGARVIAEGIETLAEYHTLVECGVHLMQGYLLARPVFEELPPFTLPAAHPAEISSEAAA